MTGENKSCLTRERDERLPDVKASSVQGIQAKKMIEMIKDRNKNKDGIGKNKSKNGFVNNKQVSPEKDEQKEKRKHD